MPGPTKISFAEWWKYEKSVFFKACHNTSRAAIGRGLFVTLLAVVGRWWFGFMAQHEIWAQILIFIGAGAMVYLGEFLIKLLCTSAKMAKEAREKSERLEKTFNEVQDRKEIECKLGNYHTMLMNRVSVIKSMGCAEHEKKHKESFWNKQFDPETAALLDEIISFLSINVGGASVAKFRDTSKLQFIQIGSSATENTSREIREKLNHHAIQLMETIDKYAENGGEPVKTRSLEP